MARLADAVDLAVVEEVEVEVVGLAAEEVVVVEEEATVTSVVSQVTLRETVLKVVEDTEEGEVVVDTAVVEVAEEEAAIAVASLGISPGIALAVDVETTFRRGQMEKYSRSLLSIYCSRFACDGSLSFLGLFSVLGLITSIVILFMRFCGLMWCL